MSATIRLFDEAEACTVYSIQFATNDKTEFDKFMEKFMNDLSYRNDYNIIIATIAKSICFAH